MTNPVLARFELKQIDAATHAQIQANNDTFRAFAEQLLAMAPAGRELSAALTALEETRYWTYAATVAACPSVTPPEITEPTA